MAPNTPSLSSGEVYRPHHHLKTQRHFSHAYGEGVKVYSTTLTLFLRENGLSHPRLGLSVRKKYGCAPRRNQFKRRIREVFRRHQGKIFPSVDIIVIPGRDAGDATYQQIEREFCALVGVSL